ncbi:MAG TPA: hypothetical protein VND65_11890, partial [Candidatus Binatia bacterium]|nr:hypothetical protein [Candidatus Binatia bacterium]
MNTCRKVLYSVLSRSPFLNYINNPANGFHSSTTAMCAQGSSAGSGAVAYSIVWYGVGSTLNN